jgi:hypothetical protein
MDDVSVNPDQDTSPEPDEGVPVTRADIDQLPGAIAASDLPAKELLAAIARALQGAAGTEESVTVTMNLVEGLLSETFNAAFEPAPAPTHGTHQVLLRMKITR